MARLSEIAGTLFPTTQVGSYPRPSWYNQDLRGRDVREAFRDLRFREAYEDATASVIKDQERAGLDVLVDGRMWYDRYDGFIGSYAMYLQERIGGVKIVPEPSPLLKAVASIPGFSGATELFSSIAPAYTVVVDKVTRGPLRLADLWRIAQEMTAKPVKGATAMGPFQQSFFVVNQHYPSQRELALDLAAILNEEMREMAAAGARIIQLDDLGLIFADLVGKRELLEQGVEVLNEAFRGVSAYKILHMCHGGTPAPVGLAPYERLAPYVAEVKADAFEMSSAQTGYPEKEFQAYAEHLADKDLGIGVISNKNNLIEEPGEIVAGLQKALRHLDASHLYLTTDCGIITYPRSMARAKLRSMVLAARSLRKEQGAA